MVTSSDTLSTALLLVGVGALLAGLGVFFVGFAQFIKSDRDGKGWFRKG
jgi:hypothetical protein